MFTSYIYRNTYPKGRALMNMCRVVSQPKRENYPVLCIGFTRTYM